jgi:pyruvate dehydrogenase E2 component (dihydrolipoamide acetyltransferase)
MPRLSDSMEEGTILRWLKGEGEHVARGEELVEIETDKATMVYESDQEGTLHLLAGEGETLPVGATIATVGAAAGDEDEEGGVRGGAPAADVHKPVEASAKAPDATPAPGEAGATEGPSAGETTAVEPSSSERLKASPLARRMARESGVDLASLHGSGPGGRIVKADVLAGAGVPTGAESGRAAAEATAPGSSAGGVAAAPDSTEGPGGALANVATAKGETTEIELTRTQQAVARRMAESKATIPDFTLQLEVDMEDCVALRAQLKGIAGDREGEPVPTYNDMVVKAAALGLREFPLANGSYRDGRVQLHGRVNVGVAVAAEGSLVVPTVFDAAEKSLGEIARETRALAVRVRNGSITPPELGGGTFTVSNLGMFGIDSFTAIVNPPQAAILSVGSLEQRAVVRDGAVVARHTMSLTLACDHRILYGADAARFLARIGELLESPASMTL